MIQGRRLNMFSFHWFICIARRSSGAFKGLVWLAFSWRSRDERDRWRGREGKERGRKGRKSEAPPVVFTSDWQQLNGTVFVTQLCHMRAKKGNPAGAVPPREPPGGEATNCTSRNHAGKAASQEGSNPREFSEWQAPNQPRVVIDVESMFTRRLPRT